LLLIHHIARFVLSITPKYNSHSKEAMKFSQAVFLFAMLGVASARVGDSMSESGQGEARNLQEDVIKVEISIPTNTIVTHGGSGTLALGGPNDNIRVMVGYKNDQGKLKAIATEASELINEFKIVDVLTMIIPKAVLEILDSDPDIE
jgi:hypothetical protein